MLALSAWHSRAAVRRKGESSDFLRALNQRDRACDIDQPDVNMEGRCNEQLIQP